MRDWRERLNGEKGISILYGILFMLVAVMVASLMLGAAATAATRVDSEQERNQDSLALRSAAELVREYIEGSSFTVRYDKNWSTGKVFIQQVAEVYGGPSKNLELELKNPLNELKEKSYYSDFNKPEKATPRDFQIKVNSSDSRLPEVLVDGEVEVSYFMQLVRIDDGDIVRDRYKIIATITLKGRSQRLFLTAYNDLDPNSQWTDQTLNWPASNITLSTESEATK